MNKGLYHITRILAKYSTPILSLVESIEAKKKSTSTDNHPIYIIGAPRSGTTLLYQLITNNDEVLYISNFINLFYRNINLGFRIADKLFNKPPCPHNSFFSNLGNTLDSGWNAPSESGNFWYQWIDKSNNYEITNNLDSSKISEIRDLIDKIMNRYGKTLVFKNLNNSQRLPLLSKIDAESKIIWVQRDPVFTAQSILQARWGLGIKKNKVWSVNPKGMRPDLYQNEYELVANQVALIESQIKKDLQLFPNRNILIVNYASIKNDLLKILHFCGISSKPPPNMINSINLTNKKSLNREEWAKLEKEIYKLESS